MLSVSAPLASTPCSAPATTATFRDRVIALMERQGGTVVSSKSEPAVGGLCWFAEELPSGRVRFEVVEPPPFGGERDAVESAAAWMQRWGYRVLACPDKLHRLTICRGRVTQ